MICFAAEKKEIIKNDPQIVQSILHNPSIKTVNNTLFLLNFSWNLTPQLKMKFKSIKLRLISFNKGLLAFAIEILKKLYTYNLQLLLLNIRKKRCAGILLGCILPSKSQCKRIRIYEYEHATSLKDFRRLLPTQVFVKEVQMNNEIRFSMYLRETKFYLNLFTVCLPHPFSQKRSISKAWSKGGNCELAVSNIVLRLV